MMMTFLVQGTFDDGGVLSGYFAGYFADDGTGIRLGAITIGAWGFGYTKIASVQLHPTVAITAVTPQPPPANPTATLKLAMPALDAVPVGGSVSVTVNELDSLCHNRTLIFGMVTRLA